MQALTFSIISLRGPSGAGAVSPPSRHLLSRWVWVPRLVRAVRHHTGEGPHWGLRLPSIQPPHPCVDLSNRLLTGPGPPLWTSVLCVLYCFPESSERTSENRTEISPGHSLPGACPRTETSLHASLTTRPCCFSHIPVRSHLWASGRLPTLQFP